MSFSDASGRDLVDGDEMVAAHHGFADNVEDHAASQEQLAERLVELMGGGSGGGAGAGAASTGLGALPTVASGIFDPGAFTTAEALSRALDAHIERCLEATSSDAFALAPRSLQSPGAGAGAGVTAASGSGQHHQQRRQHQQHQRSASARLRDAIGGPDSDGGPTRESSDVLGRDGVRRCGAGLRSPHGAWS